MDDKKRPNGMEGGVSVFGYKLVTSKA